MADLRIFEHRYRLRVAAGGVLLPCAAVLSMYAQDGAATLHGTIVDASTHRPIARVLVESPSGGPSVLTDNAGHFTFAGVPPGTVQVRYWRPGYYDPLSGQPHASRTLTLAANSGDQELPLEAAASIHGQIVLSDGDSAAGFRVDLLQQYVTDGRRRWQQMTTAPARSDGSFAFNDLRPGSYILHCQASLDQSPGDTPPGTRFGYPPVYAPDTGEIASATVFALAPGQAADAKIRVARAPFYPVSVHVTGESAGGSFFQISGNGFTNWPPRYSRESETLETELPRGNYIASAGGRSRQAVAGDLPFHVEGGPLSGPTLSVSEMKPIAVTTQTAGATSTTVGGPPRIILFLFLPVDSSDTSRIAATVDYDENTGTAQLRRGLPPGQYWVSAAGISNGGFVSSLTSGGTDLLTQPLSVTAGAAPTIAATLRQDGGQITVTREGALAQGYCFIHLIPLGGNYEEVVTDADESRPSVTFANLPPGDYLVLATASRGMFAFRDAGVLRQLTGAHVSVSAAGAAQATLSTMFTPPPGSTGPS